MLDFLQSYGIWIVLGFLFLFVMRGHAHGVLNAVVVTSTTGIQTEYLKKKGLSNANPGSIVQVATNRRGRCGEDI